MLVKKNSFIKELSTTAAVPLITKFSKKQLKQTKKKAHFHLEFLSSKLEKKFLVIIASFEWNGKKTVQGVGAVWS